MTNNYFCAGCKREDLAETAFPTVTGVGRNYDLCRACIRVAREARQSPEFIHPKIKALVAAAPRAEVSEVENSRIIGVTIRHSEAACEGSNMLALIKRAESVHVVADRRTGKIYSATRYTLTDSAKIDFRKRFTLDAVISTMNLG